MLETCRRWDYKWTEKEKTGEYEGKKLRQISVIVS